MTLRNAVKSIACAAAAVALGVAYSQAMAASRPPPPPAKQHFNNSARMKPPAVKQHFNNAAKPPVSNTRRFNGSSSGKPHPYRVLKPRGVAGPAAPRVGGMPALLPGGMAGPRLGGAAANRSSSAVKKAPRPNWGSVFETNAKGRLVPVFNKSSRGDD